MPPSSLPEVGELLDGMKLTECVADSAIFVCKSCALPKHAMSAVDMVDFVQCLLLDQMDFPLLVLYWTLGAGRMSLDDCPWNDVIQN